jgi:hypothetical protein
LQEGHDPGPSDNQLDTPDLAIVKIEKVGEDGTGGLLLQVDSGQGDAASQMQRLGVMNFKWQWIFSLLCRFGQLTRFLPDLIMHASS